MALVVNATIDVEGLDFTYPGNRERTLRALDFQVHSGEILGLLGPSGSGKSTTQRILIGLLQGWKGNIRVRGQDLARYGTEYYESIGVSFELPNHFNKLTGIENLRLFAALYDQDTRDPMELLELVDLAGAAHQRLSDWSKGMRMRLNFVRALLPNPEILFLDEPTSGMDPANARRIKNLILDLRSRGCTVFLSTHNMTDADELCDRVAFIVDGGLRAVDTPRSLKVGQGARRVVVESRREGRLERAEFPLVDLGRNEAFLQLLREADVETIHTQEATLEDVFLATTGRALT